MAPAELAREMEQRGFESVWSGEYSHIPAAMKTRFPGDGEIKRHYLDVMDPFVTLTAAAMATKTLKIGTGVCLIAQRDPIQTAKLVASIDRISGGRLLFGVGDGWNREEIENHGTVFASRHKRARENVEAMKQIWTQTTTEYHGEFVNFDSMMTWPKPVQKPHPPILVGGAFPWSARRAIRYGDGWVPGSTGGHRDIVSLIPRFRQMAAEAGRDPDALPITAWYPARDLELLHRYHKPGVERVVFSVPSAQADIVQPALDEIGALTAAVNA
jgi:probable F420-dependent oxidoreductase